LVPEGNDGRVVGDSRGEGWVAANSRANGLTDDRELTLDGRTQERVAEVSKDLP